VINDYDENYNVVLQTYQVPTLPTYIVNIKNFVVDTCYENINFYRVIANFCSLLNIIIILTQCIYWVDTILRTYCALKYNILISILCISISAYKYFYNFVVLPII